MGYVSRINGCGYIRGCGRSHDGVIRVILAIGAIVDHQSERIRCQTRVVVFERSVKVGRMVVASRLVHRVGDLDRWRLIINLDAKCPSSTIGVDVLDRHRAAVYTKHRGFVFGRPGGVIDFTSPVNNGAAISVFASAVRVGETEVAFVPAGETTGLF